MKVKVAIVGGRDFNDYDLVLKALAGYDIKAIVSGGANGADSLAERYAADYGLPLIVFKPDWKKHGRGAGIVRNKEIVQEADEVVAFWDGKSRGTNSTIGFAEKANKPLKVVRY